MLKFQVSLRKIRVMHDCVYSRKNSYKHELSGLSYLQDHFRKTFLPRIQIESYFQWLPRIIFFSYQTPHY